MEPTLACKRLSNGNKFRVVGGLHHLKGNAKPYFSLTYEETTARGRFEACGAGHAEILARFPKFRDLAALHLCDDDGVPMHVLENGFYHIGGTEWQGPDFLVTAKHFRITEREAEDLAKEIFREHYSPTAGNLGSQRALPKARLAAWIKTQENRWKDEARACIKAHALKVYHD